MLELFPRRPNLVRLAALIVLGLSVLGTRAQAQWAWQNPQPQGNPLNAVAFTDQNTGVAVGQWGVVLRTTDGGSSWTMLQSGTSVHLNGVTFGAADTAWIVGNGGLIMRSVDRGLSWTVQPSGTTRNLNDVFALNRTTVVAVGDNGTVVQTLNAGANWAAIPTGTSNRLVRTVWADVLHGWLGGSNGLVFRTIDGGASWGSSTTAPGVTNTGLGFYSTTMVWAAGEGGQIWHSNDAGAHWLMDVSPTIQRVNRLVSAGWTRYAVCDAGILLWSTNYGNNSDSVWNFLLQPIYDCGLFCGNAVWNGGDYDLNIVGDKGAMLKYSGGMFTNMAPGIRSALYGLQFTGQTAGCAVGDSGIIYRTVDGTTWTIQPSGTKFPLRSISMMLSNLAIGFIAGEGGWTLVSTDGGFSWRKDSILTDANGIPVTFRSINAPAQTGNISTGTAVVYAVGNSGIVYKRTNDHWNRLTTLPVTTGLNCVNFSDNDFGAVVGLSGTTYLTTDGGTTWTNLRPPTTSDLYSVSVYHGSVNTGGHDYIFISGNNGLVLRSDDRGATWVNVNTGYGGAIRTLNLYTTSNNNRFYSYGLAAGAGGTVFSTTNSGDTWKRETTPTTNVLFSVWLVDQSTGYACGDNGTVIGNVGTLGLPVELVSFTGVQSGSDVRLDWRTANEQNNAGFRVERATDGIWNDIGFVGGNGTSTIAHNYSLVDRNVPIGTHDYRLTQVDRSGASGRSVEISVTVVAPSRVALFQNYPNPFNPTTQIAFDLPSAQSARIDVVDDLGRVIATVVDGTLDAGRHVVNFDASSLTSGIYTYRLSTATNTLARQLTLVK